MEGVVVDSVLWEGAVVGAGERLVRTIRVGEPDDDVCLDAS